MLKIYLIFRMRFYLFSSAGCCFMWGSEISMFKIVVRVRVNPNNILINEKFKDFNEKC